ncbi:cupin domain-containing protein [Streptomyces johnsoniae]|uniref:AraC family ligand binding domain-containing protein n=1 Tax=Streptomyces johnsoniae TaxID=3075532 RepID=A0ABU2S242_9ACTN|nr:cupin domain-containing protein [Streptomyces sp. DSM 41886]MDT0442957.1 AraC family ligand binding domain-containing protein [Streptomyces sp. DSM 41886]
MTSVPPEPPHLDLYTRNGFTGPATPIVRAQYPPPYSRVHGSYAPHRMEVGALVTGWPPEPRALPVPLLAGEGVSVEAARREVPMPFALRNVRADELHYVLRGQARLETDHGVLDVRAGDFVLLPRAVTYRFGAVAEPLEEIVVVTEDRLTLRTDDDPEVLDTRRHVDAPAPQGPPPAAEEEYEVVIRHGDGLTSFFHPVDPLPCLAVEGTPAVRRFRIEDVHAPDPAARPDPMPVCLLGDDATRTMIYSVGSRRTPRPPVHRNADYDEVIVYVAGPGAYGAVDAPGTLLWTPKGVAHQGPEEDVPGGYRAWLLETRAFLSPTPAGRAVARLMETSEFGVHPSAADPR